MFLCQALSAAVVCYHLLGNTNLHVYETYRCTAPSIHMASHNDERTFKCDLCGWSLKRKSHWTTRMRILLIQVRSLRMAIFNQSA